MREKHRFSVTKNRALRHTFVPNTDEFTGEWRRLHKQELYALSSPNIIWVIKSKTVRWTWNVARVGERGVYSVLVGRPKRKRPHGRPRRRWENNIIDLQ
jgi:hypothetical protein